MPNPDEWLTVTQVAEALGITDRAVRHRIVAGTLAAVKLGPGTAQYVIERADLERVLSAEKAS